MADSDPHEGSGAGTYDPDAPLVTLEELHAAREVVMNSGHCVRTPLLKHVESLFGIKDVDLYLKLENMQVTGSFKIRGVINQLSQLPAGTGSDERKIVTASAGNYGKAFGYMASKMGLKGLVLLPDTAPKNRTKIIEAFPGITTRTVGLCEIFAVQDKLFREENMFRLLQDDVRLVAGYARISEWRQRESPVPTFCGRQYVGTSRNEIWSRSTRSTIPDSSKAMQALVWRFSKTCDVDVVLVCCGGGGLVSGIASAIKLSKHNPACKIYAVEPCGSRTMYESFKAGRAVGMDVKSVASGLSPPSAGKTTYRHCKAFVEDIILVTDEEIVSATFALYNKGLLVEPSGAAAFSALYHKKVAVATGSKVVVVVTGGNVTPEELVQLQNFNENA